MVQELKKFIRDEEGATAVEYGLIAGLIAIALVIVLNTLSGGLENAFDNIVNAMSGASSGSGGSGGSGGS